MTDYLTVTEAAELLRVKPLTIRERMRLGVFRRGVHYFRRQGMRSLFKRSALIQWLEGQDGVEDRKKQGMAIPMSRGYDLGG